MRLLHTATNQLHWFASNPPAYTILSHRWLGTETTLQAFVAEASQPEAAWSAGTAKVMRFCREVRLRHGTEYVWVDTCCIDKTSSTELQEAIKSMFAWYEEATLAVVWLDDVVAPESGQPQQRCRSASDLRKARLSGREQSFVETQMDESVWFTRGKLSDWEQSFVETQMAGSPWFTRGWTLQELVAPKKLVFVDRNWKHLGAREDFEAAISQITHIPSACLGDTWSVRHTSIAERMSWFSRRKTTRSEDMAFCMLGIFDVNMPMLYGEGYKTFQRLQRELIDASDDESIFVWTRYDEIHEDLAGWVPPSSVLAPLPRCFEAVLGRQVEKGVEWFDRAPLRVTGKGLMMEVWDRPGAQWEAGLTVPLNVKVDGLRVVLELSKLGHNTPEGRHASTGLPLSSPSPPRRITKWFRPLRDELMMVDDEVYQRPMAVGEHFSIYIL